MGLVNSCFMSTIFAFFLMGGLIGKDYAGEPIYSTLPISAFVAGAAISVIPISMLMARYGRRLGFLIGSIAGMASGVLCYAAWAYSSFISIFTAGFLVGILTASSSYLRFAALEITPEQWHGRSVSIVLGGGIIAAAVGPHSALVVNSLFDTHLYPSLGLALIAINMIAFVLCLLIKFGPRPNSKSHTLDFKCLMGKVRFQLQYPLFLRAATASVTGYIIMTLIMNASPLTLVDNLGYSLETTAIIMQNHFFAMFIPFVISGYLLDHIGANRIVYIGFFLYAICLFILLISTTIPAFQVALVLLGLGWNFTFLGGTTLLFTSGSAEQSLVSQPLNEFSIDLGNFFASMFVGWALYTIGWVSILLVGGILTTLALLIFSLLNYIVLKQYSTET